MAVHVYQITDSIILSITWYACYHTGCFTDTMAVSRTTHCVLVQGTDYTRPVLNCLVQPWTVHCTAPGGTSGHDQPLITDCDQLMMTSRSSITVSGKPYLTPVKFWPWQT